MSDRSRQGGSTLVFNSIWRRLRREFALCLASVVVVSSLCGTAHGQGVLVLETGAGGPLISEQVLLAGTMEPVERISFVFGFTTDEVEEPNTFLDSVTISLSDPSSERLLTIVTVDAATAFWAPPGATVPIDESEILREELSYPGGVPSRAMRRAWEVELAVPQEFRGAPLILYFDLFDNNNSAGSAAWLDNIDVQVVPEPAAGSLVLAGLSCLALKRRRAAS